MLSTVESEQNHNDWCLPGDVQLPALLEHCHPIRTLSPLVGTPCFPCSWLFLSQWCACFGPLRRVSPRPRPCQVLTIGLIPSRCICAAGHGASVLSGSVRATYGHQWPFVCVHLSVTVGRGAMIVGVCVCVDMALFLTCCIVCRGTDVARHPGAGCAPSVLRTKQVCPPVMVTFLSWLLF